MVLYRTEITWMIWPKKTWKLKYALYYAMKKQRHLLFIYYYDYK